MSQFAGHDYDPPYIPPQHTPRLQRKRHQKLSVPLSKVNRPLTRFHCNDCNKKFQTRVLANRNTNAVQHYCSFYSKTITRKIESHSKKCTADHGTGPCVIQRTDIDPDSDGEDETKVAYYADKSKKQSNFKRRVAHTKKRKCVDVYEPIPSKKQRRNHKHGTPSSKPARTNNYEYFPSPTNVDEYYHANNCVQADASRSPHYPQQLTPAIIPPHHNVKAPSISTQLPLEHNGDSHCKHQPEQEQEHTIDENTEFEVLNIKNHIVLDGETLYRVSWKSCYYKSVNQFLPWIKEMKKVQKHSTLRWKVDWKDSWVPQQDLHCADLLAAYILTDLKKRSEAEIARNRFKQCCCQMLHYAEAQ
eukprot:238370_1